MSGEKHKVLDTLDQYFTIFKVLQSTNNHILYLNRENESSNSDIMKQLVKEVQEAEQIKTDSLCTEIRILG